MRFWILLVTMCSLLSLPFSGTLTAADVMRDHMTQPASLPAQHAHKVGSKSDVHQTPQQVAAQGDSEHCPSMTGTTSHHDTHSGGAESDHVTADCCEEMDCVDCPPDCGHCISSGHGSCATLAWQHTFSSAALESPIVTNTSFYQRLSGQPTPPPIIS